MEKVQKLLRLISEKVRVCELKNLMDLQDHIAILIRYADNIIAEGHHGKILHYSKFP